MEDKTVITLAALLALCVIEVCALTQGINGQLLMVVLIIIAGAIGIPIGHVVKDRAHL